MEYFLVAHVLRQCINVPVGSSSLSRVWLADTTSPGKALVVQRSSLLMIVPHWLLMQVQPNGACPCATRFCTAQVWGSSWSTLWWNWLSASFEEQNDERINTFDENTMDDISAVKILSSSNHGLCADMLGNFLQTLCTSSQPKAATSAATSWVCLRWWISASG